MGMLGALAIGGLLGSLLFGGAFNGLNFMDILIFAGLAYFLYRMFVKRKQTRYDYAAANANRPNSNAQNNGFDTDLLFKENASENRRPSAEQVDAEFSSNQRAAIQTPAGFDEADFLQGAKNCYRSLQKAWDQGELAEIRGLTTDKIFSEIQLQMDANDSNQHTEIISLKAELLELHENQGNLEAAVLFHAILKEQPEAPQQEIEEVWHFTKPKGSRQPGWYLDGIQQLEN